MEGELERPIEEIEQFEQIAMGYLDTAKAALESAQLFDANVTLHYNFFNSTGISEADLEQVASYGATVITNLSAITDKSKISSTTFGTAKRLKHLAITYQGIDPTNLLNPEVQDSYKAVVSRAADPPTQKAELDQLISDFNDVLARRPSVSDFNTMVGLCVVKLAKIFSPEDAQAKIRANSSFPHYFINSSPIHQATLITGTYFEGNLDTALITNTLRDTFFDPHSTNAAEEAALQAMVTEFTITRSMYEGMLKGYESILEVYRSLIVTAVNQAANSIGQMMQERTNQVGVSIDDLPQTQLAELLENEARIESASKTVARRAKSIIEEARSLRRSRVILQPVQDLNFEDFPVAETPIRDQLKLFEIAQRTGEIAAAQTIRLEAKQKVLTELEEIRSRYLMPRTKVKKYPDGSTLTALLIRGKANDHEWGGEILNKDEAYTVAAVLYRLDELLSAQDSSVVFNDFFETVKREAELASQVDEPTTVAILGEPSLWLLNNIEQLRDSPIEVLSHIGNELMAYRTTKLKIDQLSELVGNEVSAETVNAIKAARLNARFLEIRAFPPGVSNIEALEEDSMDLVTRPGRKIPAVEWERLLALDELSLFFTHAGFHAELFRLLPGSLHENFPYYALVLSTGNKKVIVAENPKKPNATYIFEELDPELASWQDIIQLDKRSTKELGGRAMTHSSKSSLDRHKQRIQNEVILRLTSGS